MGIISLISSKRGKLYLKFVLALAVIAAAIYAYSAIAAVPAATPFRSYGDFKQELKKPLWRGGGK